MIILTRHAKSSHNKKNILAGSRVDSSLVKEGKLAAEKHASRIALKYGIDVIICSSLKRSYQTAKIHQKQQKEKYRKEVAIIKTPFLNEVDVGVISGMTVENAIKRYPNEYKKTQSKLSNNFKFIEGETSEILKERYLKLKNFIKKYDNKNILLIGHALFNQFILKEWMNINKTDFDHNYCIELSV